MKKIFFHISILLLCCGGVSAQTPPVSTGTVVIKVSGLRNDGGQAVGALFGSEEGFPAEFSGALMRATGTIKAGQAQLVFSSVPYGRYAAVIGHDENLSGSVEMAGTLPAEGMGVSNNAMPEFGPPQFSYAAFKVNRPETVMDCDINYGPLTARRNFPADFKGRKTGNISVTLDDFSSEHGFALVGLYAVADGFPYEFAKAAMLVYAPIREKRALAVFKDVPYGKYAFVAFHDINGNGRLDTDKGYPSEGVAASSDAVHDFVPLLFNSAVFEISGANTALSADMKYAVKHLRQPEKIIEPGKGGDLIFKIDGAEGDTGLMAASVFSSADGFSDDLAKAAATVFVTITGGQAIAVFKNLPYGKYAAAVFQDKDADGEIDRNLIGRPTERTGYSLNVYGFWGTAPSFGDAAFQFGKDGETLSIHIK